MELEGMTHNGVSSCEESLCSNKHSFDVGTKHRTVRYVALFFDRKGPTFLEPVVRS